jgi:hypothetical protein
MEIGLPAFLPANFKQKAGRSQGFHNHVRDPSLSSRFPPATPPPPPLLFLSLSYFLIHDEQMSFILYLFLTLSLLTVV